MFFDFIKNKFAGVFVAEKIFPAKIRKILKLVLMPMILIFLVAIFYNGVISQISFGFLTKIKIPVFKLPMLPVLNKTLWGFDLLALSMRFIVLAFESFIFNKTKDKKGASASDNLADKFNIYVSEIWHKAGLFADTKDLALSILSTAFGQNVLLRLGVFPQEYKTLVSQIPKENWTPKDAFLGNLEQVAVSGSSGGEISSAIFLKTLFKSVPELNQFFVSKEIFEDDIKGAADWMEEVFSEEDIAKRWWLKKI